MEFEAFKNWPLRRKTLVPATLVAIIGAMSLFAIVNKTQRDLVILQARRTAQAISAQIAADRAVYTEMVVGKLTKDGIPIQPDDREQFPNTIGGIPLPASFVHETSERVNAQGFHTADLLSLWNINSEKGPRNDQERAALEYVAEHPDAYRDWVVEERDGGAQYFQVTADLASAQSCVTCHNNHPRSSRTDFRLNDVMGGLVISLTLDEEFAIAKKNGVVWTALLMSIFLVLIVLILGIQWRFVSKPLIQLEQAADRISRGEIESTIDSSSTDEIGRLAAAFERMRVSIATAMDLLSKRGSSP